MRRIADFPVMQIALRYAFSDGLRTKNAQKSGIEEGKVSPRVANYVSHPPCEAEGTPLIEE
jgi:hypothetical protein